MSVQRVNTEFDLLMRRMVEAQECAQGNIQDELRRIIRTTVNSCASMYGFSAEEAFKRLNSDGEIIEIVISEKEKKLQVKEAEKAEKEEKRKAKAEEKRKKSEKQCARFWEKQQKIEDILSKAAEKLRLKEVKKLAKESKKLAKKTEKKQKANESNDEESIASTIIMTSSDDEEPYVLFQNIPLINEINSIRNVKKFKNWKKLSAGVKLARQLLDI